jgi:hypothetical protein
MNTITIVSETKKYTLLKVPSTMVRRIIARHERVEKLNKTQKTKLAKARVNFQKGKFIKWEELKHELAHSR